MSHILNFVLVKPAGPDCNMNCTYCFYLEKAELFPEKKVHSMSEEILDEMIRQAMIQAKQNISLIQKISIVIFILYCHSLLILQML